MALVWFAAGATDGPMHAILDAALRVGDSVASADSRKGRLADLREAYPGRLLLSDRVVGVPGDSDDAVAETLGRFGRIDVILSSGGLAAVIALLRRVLPVLRTQSAGLIVHLAAAESPALDAAMSLAAEAIVQALAEKRTGAGVAVVLVQLPRRRPAALARAAEIVVTAAHRGTVPSHLVLGGEALERRVAGLESRLAEARLWAAVSRSVDDGSPYPLPLP